MVKNTTSNDTLQNVEGQGKQKLKSEIINREEILNTPFELIEIDGENEKGCFIAWGKFRLTDIQRREDILEKALNLENGYTDWELIGTMAACIAINIINEQK